MSPQIPRPGAATAPATFSVCPCLTCEEVMVVMDPMSGPKWKMACNKCNMVLHVFEDAFKVSLSEDGCDECGASLIDVTFHRNKSPLQGDKTEHTGCAFCDPVLVPSVVECGRYELLMNLRRLYTREYVVVWSFISTAIAFCCYCQLISII